MPALAVKGSSKRERPSRSVAGQFATDEFAASIAGEPEDRWKSPEAGSTNFAFAWIEWSIVRKTSSPARSGLRRAMGDGAADRALPQ